MNRPWFFTSVDLGIMLWNGVYEAQRGLWLRWADSEGKPIPTGAERAEQEYQRAEAERQRAEQEAAARAKAEAEIARLRAEIERLQRGQA